MNVLVRANGRWFATFDGGAIEDVDLAGVLTLVDAAGDALDDTGVVPLSYDVVLEVTTPLSGELTPQGWAMEDASGALVRLDRTDLALIDRMARPATPGQVAEEAGWDPEAVALRLSRLAHHGVLHRQREEPAAVDTTTLRPPPRTPAPQGGPRPEGPPGRIPVYAIWHPHVGPLLALGMITAAARHHRGGALNEVYEIRRPETAESFLADLATRSGPAVLLCSNYVWSVDDNLATARQALALAPDLVVVHGGPSTPKYEGDAVEFLRRHGEVAHVLTRGEGEHTIGEVLDALAGTLPHLDPDALAEIDGLTFTHPATGATVRTGDRPRITDLDALPSPYLTGEFDHIPAEAWSTCLSIETNRGCPYGCTFCDWGSATLARIRKFDLDRVGAELQWAADRGLFSLNLADANFGIMSRDVEVARMVAAIRQETGYPRVISFYPAKNTTKHLSRITDILVEAGVGTTASISLQSSHPDVLDAIHRSNIATDHYVALAAEYRRRGLPLQGDLLLGLPGQTVESYRSDLQFNLDHEIMTRTWRTHVLPNAPMNDPEYKARYAIEVEDDQVVATSSFTRADRERMLRLRSVEIITERYGLLRHVLRWLQWDHGIPATAVMSDLLDLVEGAPGRFPHLTWVLRHYPEVATVPVGWRAFHREVRAYVEEIHGIEPSSALDTVLEVQRFLMPAPGRTFPATLALEHDYVAYYRAATAGLYGDGHATGARLPLAAHPPGTLTVFGDPLRLCERGIEFARFGTGEMDGDFEIGANSANELLSPLTRLLPHVTAAGVTPADLGPDAPIASAPPVAPPTDRTTVVLSRRR